MTCGRVAFLLRLFFLTMPAALLAQPGSEASGYEGQTFMERLQQGNFRPFLEGVYGVGAPKHKAFTQDFSNTGLVEFRLGFSQIQPYKDYVSTINEGYFYGGSVSKSLSLDEEGPNEALAKATRFGMGNRQGYGYQAGAIALLPYSYFGLGWTKIESDQTAALTPEALAVVERYEGSFRFGQNSEAGMKIQLGKTLAVSGGYEFSVVFPRHLFGKWLGSAMIQSIGYSASVLFSDAIVESSPVLGPLIGFVLRNGVSYVFYWQMRDAMNWPFKTEQPLTFEALKVGASITF